jgi:alpha-1,3-glucan synthase
MDCSSVASSITVDSITEDGTVASIDSESVVCSSVGPVQVSPWFGSLPTVWTFQANLLNVSDGIHVLTLQSPESQNFTSTTESTDHFFIRVGQDDNPLVFPQSANYSSSLLHQAEDGTLFISHKAAGAEQFRYSLDWGSTYSTWQQYAGGNTTLNASTWSGTSEQKWSGEHVIVQYFSSTLGSSDHIQHGDLTASQPKRRFPHLFLQGLFNQFGTDVGVDNTMKLENDGIWTFDLMTEWPDSLQVNEWGMDPDGKVDASSIFGDIDRDGVLDRLPPSALAPATISFNSTPPSPFLSWKLEINDGTYGYTVTPTGNRWNQLLMYMLMWTIPLLSGCFGAWAYLIS